MRPFRPLSLLLAVMPLTAALSFAAQAAASTSAAASQGVTCGQTITQDTTLTHDLTNCPGDGLIIGADNIRLDLGGHTISGAAHGPLQCYVGGPVPGPCFGVYPVEYSGLTITNGTIEGFDAGISGVASTASTHDHISRLTIRVLADNAIAVGSDSVVDHNRVDAPIVVEARSQALFNSGVGRAGVYPSLGDDIRVEYNTVPRIQLGQATDSYVAHNRVRGGWIGVQSASDRNVVTANLLLQSHIYVIGSNDDVISHNVVLGSPPLLDGIGVGWDPYYGHHSSDGTQVRGNVVIGAANDGIKVEYNFSATRTLVNGNVVVANGHDGIENGDASATLTGNLAVANQAFGIESVAGATDGGANRAAANGNPLECSNIACH